MSNPSSILDYIIQNELWEKEINLKRGEFIPTHGTLDQNIYFVKEGCLRVFWLSEEEEHTIRFGYCNNIIAALDSYLGATPTDFHLQALRKTQLLVLSQQKFNALLEQEPQLKKQWLEMLKALVLQQLEREKDLLISSPQLRYERVLQRSPQLFQEVPNKYIADYLRMTPETLSRIMNS